MTGVMPSDKYDEMASELLPCKRVESIRGQCDPGHEPAYRVCWMCELRPAVAAKLREVAEAATEAADSRWDAAWDKHCQGRHGGCEIHPSKAERDQLRAQLAEFEEASAYAGALLGTVAPHSMTLPTLVGILTQLDNYCAGLRAQLAERDQMISVRDRALELANESVRIRERWLARAKQQVRSYQETLAALVSTDTDPIVAREKARAALDALVTLDAALSEEPT